MHRRSGRVAPAVHRDRPARERAHTLRAWAGEVFYDHLRGVRDPEPEPTGWPFLLVLETRCFEWHSTGTTRVESFTEAAPLIARAEAAVAAERAAGVGAEELWKVYGLRIVEHVDRRGAD